ncbi:MAG: rRNA maturation RNase YbeY [Halobacteriovoraceae bacterium]|nr:rRNA maturation RNase YbeY [Halobacteriovoraceae bacterium]
MKRQLTYGKLSLLVIDNSQDRILSGRKRYLSLLKASLPELEKLLLKHFIHRKIERMEFSLSLCGSFKIRNLNKKYRKKDKVTDVLAFPLHENFSRKNQFSPYLHLGDIFICRQKAAEQSVKEGISLHAEYLHLFIHGFLHLLGMDHEKSLREAKYMESWEKRLNDRILHGWQSSFTEMAGSYPL